LFAEIWISSKPYITDANAVYRGTKVVGNVGSFACNKRKTKIAIKQINTLIDRKNNWTRKQVGKTICR